MHQWYVVHTLSANEKKVKKTLEDQKELKGMVDYIDEVLLPIENISEVKKGQQKIVEKRMWPGYLLVHMMLTDDSWAYIKNTPGVIDFLGGEKPTPLTEKEVKEILKDIDEKKQKVVQKHGFKVGDTVKIIDGVFVNFIGVITEVNSEKGKMSVLVSIFGRETQVDDLDFLQVEEVSEDEEVV
ncbi:MAG: transcription termination/antitermination protein NusG [Waddliaceae bacterium]